MNHRSRRAAMAITVLLGGVSTLMLGPHPTSAQQFLSLDQCAPAKNSFTLTINNEYFPLPIGKELVLQGEDEGEIVGLQILVLNQTEILYPGPGQVITRVVRETEWKDEDEDGEIDGSEDLIEVSLNYFAQTQAGTVCYFGEAVDIYHDGGPITHEGAWRADDPGNAPGIFMPAAAMPGMKFQQEVAPGVALDQATIIGSGPVEVPADTFKKTIRLGETNPLEGGNSKGYKVYASAVGLIVDSSFELISY